jgi:hypothetical protein
MAMSLTTYLISSFLTGFFVGYLTRKNWFIFRRIFSGKPITNKSNSKKTDKEDKNESDAKNDNKGHTELTNDKIVNINFYLK